MKKLLLSALTLLLIGCSVPSPNVENNFPNPQSSNQENIRNARNTYTFANGFKSRAGSFKFDAPPTFDRHQFNYKNFEGIPVIKRECFNGKCKLMQCFADGRCEDLFK